MTVLEGKHIVLGVTGSIAAYKSVDLASQLTKKGALVDVILTEAAAKLVAPLTFSSVTGRRAYQEEDLWQVDDHVLHIKLGEENQTFLIAPATANIIAKLAAGIADDMLCCTVLATKAPVIMAPAMNVNMYENSVTQDNLAKLRARDFAIVGPAYGRLASG